MNVVYRILIVCGVGIGCYIAGSRLATEKCEHKHTNNVATANATAVSHREKVHRNNISNSRDVNVCWLCDNWAAYSNKPVVSANASVRAIPVNEQSRGSGIQN